MIVPVHIVGYSNMMNSINGNTQSNTVYFQTVDNKPVKKQKKPRFLSLADAPLLTVAALSTKPKTLSAFAKSFMRLPLVIAGLAIPASIAAGITSKVVESRNKRNKDTSPTLALAGFGAAWYGLYKAGEAGIKKVVQSVPETNKTEIVNQLKTIGEKIDASSLNKKVYEPAANKVKQVLKAHPQIWKPAIIISTIAALAISLAPSAKRSKKAAQEQAQREQIARMVHEQYELEMAQRQEFEKLFNKVM